jgi:antitoxin component YwqK of YwqJK toxin-antitoxin module
MKRILSLLIVCVLIGCSEKRIIMDELTVKVKKVSKGTHYVESYTYYCEDGLFNGVGFDVNYKGIVVNESTFKDGKLNGLQKEYYKNGQLKKEYNIKDDLFDGLYKQWYENGQLEFEETYDNGVLIE